jgi:ubiquinol-cytochrome c reductase cytochrome c1 subunit
MNILSRKTILLGLVSFLVSTSALAAGGAHLEPSGANIKDMASLQRGAGLFVNYCLSCHSASFMRYSRLSEDLGLSEDVVLENLVFSDAKIGDTMEIAMDAEDAERWFGKAPPDLSLIGRSRGADWLYAYMRSFYQDEKGEWNNTILLNAAMPHVLWELQGIQKIAKDDHGEDQGDGHSEAAAPHFELVVPGRLSPEEYDSTVRDLVNFLDYLGEPAKLKRKNIGVWVILFLAVFAFLAYLLKAEYWRDVH